MLATNKVASINSGDKLIEKFIKPKTGKLSKSQKSKSEKLAKSKKLSKNENLSKFATKKAEPGFLTSNTINCLWLTFIKVLILWHLDQECHI